MENVDLLKSQLEIDNIAAAHLSDTAKWGKFLAIIGFIFCGLLVIGGIAFSVLVSSASGYYGNIFSRMGPAIGVIYILIALVYFFPCLFLLRFSVKMKAALLTNDQETMNEAFSQHRRMYKFVGILTIIFLALYALGLIFGVLGSAFR